MKFLAILRDSLREALDYKVIYFLLGLSAFVILVAFSISFKPEPGEKGLQTMLNQLPGARAVFGPAPLDYKVEDFKQLNEGKPAWEGAYRYTLVITEAELPADKDGDDEDDGKKKKEKQPSLFRVFAVASLLQEKEASKLDDEDRATRERVARSGGDIFKGGVPTQRQMRQLNEVLAREAERLSDRQLTNFLVRAMGSSGTLETTELKLTGQKEREYRFQVESRAKPDAIRTWPHDISFLFGAVDLPIPMGVGDFIYLFQDRLVNGLGAAVTMLLGAVITAFFIPNMLRKGTVDLLVSKPVHRWSLLLYKYVGGLLFVLLPTVLVVVGIWLALGVRSGFWGTGFLLSIPILTLQFAIFYAISTLVGVVTRSPILCILACCLAWAGLWITSGLESLFKPADPDEKKNVSWVYTTSSTARKLLPRYKDLDTLASELVARDLLAKDSAGRKLIEKQAEEIRWGESLGITFGYIALMLALSCWYFSVKDY